MATQHGTKSGGDSRRSEVFLRELVRQGKLTPFQANMLLEERSGQLVVGDYIVLAQLGEGKLGIVYKAQSAADSDSVVLRALPPRLCLGPDEMEKFSTFLAGIGEQLTHENLVAPRGMTTDNSKQYLISEYFDGENVQSLVLQRGTLSPGLATNIIVQAACGLQQAARSKLVHRQLNPTQILMDRQGCVKVLGFGVGLLQSHCERQSTISKSGADRLLEQISENVDYMAPELASDSAATDDRSDIYSLGCLLYFLLTGEPVYAGATYLQKILAHREMPIPPLGHRVEGIPAQLETVYRKMMAKEPADRYADYASLVHDLRICLKVLGHTAPQDASLGGGLTSSTLPPTWSVTGLVQRLPVVRARLKIALARFKTSLPEPDTQRWKQRAAGALSLLMWTLGLAVVALGAGVWYLNQEKDQAPPAAAAPVEQPEPPEERKPLMVESTPTTQSEDVPELQPVTTRSFGP